MGLFDNAPPQIHRVDVIPRPSAMRRWEYHRHHRVHLGMELVAEFTAVFLYVWFGVGSTAAFVITNLGKQPGLGSLYQVGFGYAVGIVAALVICAATSGGHFSPCVTIVLAIYRGFPWRKVPFFIIAQTLGAMVACFSVYLQYKDVIKELELLLTATQQFDSVMFTPNGPAGIFALYPNPGKPLGFIFWNEFVITTVLGLAIWASLDPTNFFCPPAAAPWFIGFVYGAAIMGFGAANMSANTARDIGGRIMALCIWGKQAGGGPYAAIAALTNIVTMVLSATIYEIFFTDSSRVLPRAQQDFLVGHQAHLNHKNNSAPEDYLHGTGPTGGARPGSSTGSDEEKARVTMRE